MDAVAYCRVSTNKNEQLDSMESQQKFFTEYAQRNDLNLVNIYADEGKSGTKMHNRTQLLKMLSDAGENLFQIVLIKDVSRLARNTVDFLTSIRNLKKQGIKVIFVNYDQTSSESSEFMLTMLSAIAQEESANTSKRVKFGKKMNAEKGRVPNYVFGYDKIPGEYFKLNINPREKEVVELIYSLYIDENMGTAKIAEKLNSMHIYTKRGCLWTQTGINRILTNPIYTGKIINSKEEVEDFLTGKRKANNIDKWDICENKELMIISEERFLKAERIMAAKRKISERSKERISEKNLFSKKIKCTHCNSSFRRYERKKIKWVCSTRNIKGVDACSNKITLNEEVLLSEIKGYLLRYLNEDTYKGFIQGYIQAYEKKNSMVSEAEVQKHIKKLEKAKEKYMIMFQNDIIDVKELKLFTEKINEDIKAFKKTVSVSEKEMLGYCLAEFSGYEAVLEKLKADYFFIDKFIDVVKVSAQGEVHIYMKAV